MKTLVISETNLLIVGLVGETRTVSGRELLYRGWGRTVGARTVPGREL